MIFNLLIDKVMNFSRLRHNFLPLFCFLCGLLRHNFLPLFCFLCGLLPDTSAGKYHLILNDR